MRLCRFEGRGGAEVGLYDEAGVVPLSRLAERRGGPLAEPSTDILDYLPPDGRLYARTRELAGQWEALEDGEKQGLRESNVHLRVPVPRPAKVILLAGNYAAHVREGGGQAAERRDTFPYFFLKPPTTTLTHPGDPIRLPAASPDHIDWEIELGVILGRRCRGVSEEDALAHVAGYTVCNDVSDRKFRINPGRQERDRDRFFDWQHGKWHDTFLPMGPCVLAAEGVDPQSLPLKLTVNGEVMQEASTSQMVFPVAALVSILSGFVTLEPGDVISTGTPAGVGAVRKPPVFLKAGDVVEAEVGGIGRLRNGVEK
jgi:2,4-diketo-3-deoxy-L-fuconate hydrolase